MLSYISHGAYARKSCVFCPVKITIPRPEDFERVYYKLNGVVYFEWSDEFARLVEAERIWNKLAHD